MRAQLELSPFGVLGLDSATLVDLPPLRLTGGTGHSTLRIPVPDLPSLAGGEINVQVLILEPLAAARLTNTWATRIR